MIISKWEVEVQNYEATSSMLPGRLMVKLEEQSDLMGPDSVLYTTNTVDSSYPQLLCTAEK